jgi:hypothetical protein
MPSREHTRAGILCAVENVNGAPQSPPSVQVCSWSTAPASAGIGRPSRLYVSAELLGLTGSNPLRG